MITLTERAAAGLEQMLLVNNAEPGQAVKLVPREPDRIGLMIDTPNEGDEVIGPGDAPLLIVDSSLRDDLDGSELDCETTVVEGEQVSEFKLRPAA